MFRMVTISFLKKLEQVSDQDAQGSKVMHVANGDKKVITVFRIMH
jgi:hypothetical protein